MRRACALVTVVAVLASAAARPIAQQAGAPTEAELVKAVAALGAFDFSARTVASRTVRRAPAAMAVPVLTRAVTAPGDSYVPFRALVLLTGFGDPATPELMRTVMTDRNDRLRALAYAWFEHAPVAAVVPRLIEALGTEASEFVRPSLMRALAASGDSRAAAALVPLVSTGETFFRAELIQAIGDYRLRAAASAVLAVAKLEGPLQEDAVLALGKLGDTSVLPVLAELQRAVPRERQPAIAAAICLLGVNCEVHRKYLGDTLAFASANAGYQLLLRSTARALGALASQGDQAAFATLLTVGATPLEASRAPIALAVGTAAVRRPTALLATLGSGGETTASLAVLRDAFDMLEEDFEEERFFVEVRRVFWNAPEGSPERKIAEAVLQTLEF